MDILKFTSMNFESKEKITRIESEAPRFFSVNSINHFNQSINSLLEYKRARNLDFLSVYDVVPMKTLG